MSFFSFGKKDDASPGRDAYSDSPRGSRQTVRTERLTRRSERSDADAMMVDPTLPERQRARRRLVGAVALVAAAVIVLPMVLDSHPKPVTDDIAIDIPARPAAPLPKTTHTDDDTPTDTPADTQAGVAPDSPPVAAATGAIKPGAKAVPASSVIAKPQAQAQQQIQAQQQAQATAETTPAATLPPPAKPSTPASPAGSRFVLQIGTFDEDGPAQNWVSKLKAAGVPAYVEHRKQADGSVRSMLRAGPFADRAAASAALAKVRRAGLGGGAGSGTGNNAGSGNAPAN